MSADVISLDERRPVPNDGNGAWVALSDIAQSLSLPRNDAIEWGEQILIELWARGFKIVPLQDGDE